MTAEDEVRPAFSPIPNRAAERAAENNDGATILLDLLIGSEADSDLINLLGLLVDGASECCEVEGVGVEDEQVGDEQEHT